MTFMNAGNACECSKSERGRGEMEIHLALFPYDKASIDVQVNFGVSRSIILGRSVLPSPTYVPKVPPRREVRAGRVEPFALLEGTPSIELSFLFIAREDVKSARNGLWHLRPELAARVENPQLRRVLTYGRTGRLT